MPPFLIEIIMLIQYLLHNIAGHDHLMSSDMPRLITSGEERLLRIGTYYESRDLHYDTTVKKFTGYWNENHSKFVGEVQLATESNYEVEANPYKAMQVGADLVRVSGCHVVISVCSCQSAVALKSWADYHYIPLILIPTQLCNQVDVPRIIPNNGQLISNDEKNLNTDDQDSGVYENVASNDQPTLTNSTTIAMNSAINELHFPAFDLALMLGFKRMVLIMDDFHYSRLYIESNAVNSSFKTQTSFFVYRMDEVNNFFDKDANSNGHDNFIVLGELKSCQRFFSNGNRHSPILKIKFTWIISCTGLTVDNFKLPQSSMAKMYLITSQQDLMANPMQRLQASLRNITRTVAESFEQMNTQFIDPRISINFATFDQSLRDQNSDYARWKEGLKLIELVRDHLKKEEHDNHSHRNLFDVFYRSIEHKNWTKKGTWNRQTGLDVSIIKHYRSTLWSPKNILKVVTVVEPPFVSEEIGPDGKVRYIGYCIDLLSEIMRQLGLKYEVYNANSYGSLIEDHWNGAVGEVVYGRADMAVSGMIITSSRQDVVDFSSRYMDYSVGILIKKEFKRDTGFGFLSPLTQKVWVSFCALIFAVGLLMYALTRISPSAELLNELSGSTDLSKFNIRNSIWFMISSIMMQGVDIQPATPSGRIIGTFWWFFSLTVTAMYTANLAAFLTVNRMETPIDSLQSLAYQNKISYGTVINSPIHLDFKEQAEMIPLYERIYASLVTDYKPSENLVADAEEGFAKVKTGKYAFMWDDAILQWIQTIHCEYISVGKPFMNKGYGIAMTKGSGLKKNVSSAILMLQEEGTLEKLKQRWFLNATECLTGTKDADQESEDDTATRGINLSSVKGIFFTLIFGVFLSLIVVSVEIWMAKSCNVRPSPEPVAEEERSSESHDIVPNNFTNNNRHQNSLLSNGDIFSYLGQNRPFIESGEWKKSIQYTEIPTDSNFSGAHANFYSDHLSPKSKSISTRNNHYQLQPFYSVGNSSLPAVNFSSSENTRWNYGQILESMDLTSNDTTPITSRETREIKPQQSFEQNGIDQNQLRHNYSLPIYTTPNQNTTPVVANNNSTRFRSRAISLATSGPRLVFYNR